MKAILLIDIPDDYEEYGNGKWYIKGDNLRIGYEEKDGSFIGKKPIENGIARLKSMPRKMAVEHRWYSEDFASGYNLCIDELLGDEE